MPRAYSEPRYDPRYDYRTPNGQTYMTPQGLRNPDKGINPPPPVPYHGPHFEKAPAQEALWNSRGSTQVWDPYQPMPSVAARPETRGRAHSIHQSRIEPQISNPYEKRPMPYTARTEADHSAYKRPSDGHGGIGVAVGKAKVISVGRKHVPSESAREGIVHGIELAKSGRMMSNLAMQSRTGFVQKYPQAYENPRAIGNHTRQVTSQRGASKHYRDSEMELNGMLRAWETQKNRPRPQESRRS